MVTVDLGGESLVLLPQKAVWWPRTHTLLVADAHVGKAVSFRRLGVPVPRGTTSQTLAVLSELIVRHGARRVVFLGDFLHSERAHAASTLGAVARWRAAHAGLDVVLVRGNHDDRAGDPPVSLAFRVVDEPFVDGGLALCHHPVAREGGYVLAGHLHPCLSLGGRAARDHLRLPCFHLGPSIGVLPAFGSFTGMHTVRAASGDRLFVVADDAVVEVPT